MGYKLMDSYRNYKLTGFLKEIQSYRKYKLRVNTTLQEYEINFNCTQY